jgi:hypothetical protein
METPQTTLSVFQQLMELDRQYDNANLTDSDKQELDRAWKELQDQLIPIHAAQTAAVVDRPPTPIPREDEWILVVEEEEESNQWEDTREGCKTCPGCMFCQESRYDDEN